MALLSAESTKPSLQTKPIVVVPVLISLLSILKHKEFLIMGRFEVVFKCCGREVILKSYISGFPHTIF